VVRAFDKNKFLGFSSIETDFLVLGGTGLLGSEFVKELSKSHSVSATFHDVKPFKVGNVNWHRLNAINSVSTNELIHLLRPKVVINCIALTDVDTCELYPELAVELNYLLPQTLAKICAELGIYLIHISTDHFESSLRIPRKEQDVVFGINQYGKTKIQGENSILNLNASALILRTNFFNYSLLRSNSFINWIINNLKKDLIIKGFTDIEFTPISIAELINCTFALQEMKINGIVNVSSNDSISKYNFISLVAETFNFKESLIEPSVSNEVQGRVRRPTYMSLNNERLSSILQRKMIPLDSMIDQVSMVYFNSLSNKK
jgi:dTDP-4-dehydrorhamnose reductase